jgi:hypothetical protein
MRRMKRLLREPLLHFLLLGAVLFWAYGWIAGTASGEREIVVDQRQLDALIATFAKTWQRPPTAEEMHNLIDAQVRDEIMYREGLALGLDRDDVVIRQRIAQKMQFLVEDSPARAPNDTELQRFLDAHSADYGIEPRYSLRQIFFDPALRGERTAAQVAKVAGQLRRQPGKADSFGDPTQLPLHFEDTSLGELQQILGTQFTRNLAGAQTGAWLGPWESGYGLHLVRIDAVEPGRAAHLDEVRERVVRDWTVQQILEARERAYQDLRQRYRVTIQAAAQSGQLAAARD